MEEIKFKPKITSDLISSAIYISFIYLIIAIPLGISLAIASGTPFTFLFVLLMGLFIAIGIYVLGVFGIVLSKIFLTYYITKDNELVIEYSFLNKSTKVYRIDQLTSFTLNQTWVDKKLGLGTINFDVFGKSIPTNQQQNQQPILPQFATIEEYEKIYEILSKKLECVEDNKPLYTTHPKTTPLVTFSVIALTLLICAILVSVIFNPLVTGILTIAGIVSTLIIFINYKRLKRTSYFITNTYAMIFHNYFFSKKITKVPISKITNIKNSKNFFSYALFEIGKAFIFTGGMRDPQFSNLEDYISFSTYLSKLSKGQKIPNTSNDKQTTKKKSTKENEEEKPVLVCKSSFMYVIKNTIPFLIFFTLVAIGLWIFKIPQWIVVPIGIYLITFLATFLYWKSLRYEFYTFKVIKYSGIITTISEELHYKNLKYISMSRSMIFDRIANVGTINLFTAGSTSIDKSILDIKRYDEVYDSFEEVLEDK